MFTETKKIIVYRTATEIADLIRAFENCTLPRSEWTHAAYLTVALWYLYLNPLPEARRLMRNAVRRYNFEYNIAAEQIGGYNETMAVFWLSEVNHYLKRHKDEHSFVSLANALVEHLPDKNLPFKYYSRQRLFSRAAKMNWMKPDLRRIGEVLETG